MCGTWFRKIQKIEDVFEGKLSVSGLVGCWMAGVVLREPPYWETLTGKPVWDLLGHRDSRRWSWGTMSCYGQPWQPLTALA